MLPDVRLLDVGLLDVRLLDVGLLDVGLLLILRTALDDIELTHSLMN
jgi:hypothetical protein